jgi:hypothetical protein
MQNIDWLTFLGDSNKTGFRPESLSGDLRLIWKEFIGEKLWGSPPIIGNTVVISGHDIRALNLNSGEVNWSNKQYKEGSGSATLAFVGMLELMNLAIRLVQPDTAMKCMS